MKEKRMFFNPLRMISPKLDAEALRIEELYQKPVSDSFTLEEGLLVMISKLIELDDIIHDCFITECPRDVKEADKLAEEVHQQEKLLTGNLVCTLSAPPDICKTVVLFPGHLERIGDYLESALNCCKIKCRDKLPFSDSAAAEVGLMFSSLSEALGNLRDALITPNQFLLRHIVSESDELVKSTIECQMAHIERLLDGSTAPRASSIYMDIVESCRSAVYHIKEMAEKMLILVTSQSS